MLKEEYKDIPDNEFVPLKEGIDPAFWGKYEINKLGEIKTLQNNKITTSYYCRHGKIPFKSFRVGTLKRGYFIHILVAKTFLIPDNEDSIEVDHINRDTLDFKLSNLRYVTRRENLVNRRKSKINASIFYQKFDDSGNLIEEYSHEDMGKKFGENKRSYIISSIRDNKKAFGFYWKRVDYELNDYVDKYKIDLSKEEFVNIPNDPINRKISSNGIILTNDWIYSVGWKDIAGYRKISINGHPVCIHRLVYELFSSDSLTSEDYIDHIDTDPQNNSRHNLRKVSQKENMNNPITIQKLSKAVLKYSLSGELIDEFPSLTKACESVGIKRNNNCIRLCCEGKILKSHGYIWKYKN